MVTNVLSVSVMLNSKMKSLSPLLYSSLVRSS